MSNLPKISVVTVSYNQGRYIRQNIESVLQQNYANFEHIIIDGGSTDETVEILKSYKHLNWVSEKDEGQADALNKGFSKASGEIIAWLNSDDWYPAGIFNTVQHALIDYPIVMGVCELIDKHGKTMYQVPNIERTWFDLIKYWVPYSIPTQPAIFFKRSLLEEFKSETKVYLDKDLYYTMDYDFWLRVATKYPFNKRIDRVFAYYRMTEDNKTSHEKEGMSYAEPEMSRLFRRHVKPFLSQGRNRIEKQFSFVIVIDEINENLKNTVASILLQSYEDFEILLVDKSEDTITPKQLAIFIDEMNQRQLKRGRVDCLRSVKVDGLNLAQALCHGVLESRAEIVSCLQPGSVVSSDFCNQASIVFAEDRIGLALPLAGERLLREDFVIDGELKLQALFGASKLPNNFLVRKIALLELGESKIYDEINLMLRGLILLLCFKGWRICANNQITLSRGSAQPEAQNLEAEIENQLRAKLVCLIEEGFESEPFAKVRLSFGASLRFEPGLVADCRKLLSDAPPRK